MLNNVMFICIALLLLIEGGFACSCVHLNFWTCDGNVEINNGDFSCLESIVYISGDLNIRNNANLTTIPDLALQSIGDSLSITQNPLLQNLNGLRNLSYVGRHIDIAYNDNLLHVDALSKITDIPGNLAIHTNDVITSISGLSQVASIGGDLKLVESQLDVNTLVNLRFIGRDFTIYGNDVITHVNGFTKLVQVNGTIEIHNNRNLLNVDGFANLVFIGGSLSLENSNDELKQLYGFCNIRVLNGTAVGNVAGCELSTLDSLRQCFCMIPYLSPKPATVPFNNSQDTRIPIPLNEDVTFQRLLGSTYFPANCLQFNNSANNNSTNSSSVSPQNVRLVIQPVNYQLLNGNASAAFLDGRIVSPIVSLSLTNANNTVSSQFREKVGLELLIRIGNDSAFAAPNRELIFSLVYLNEDMSEWLIEDDSLVQITTGASSSDEQTPNLFASEYIYVNGSTSHFTSFAVIISGSRYLEKSSTDDNSDGSELLGSKNEDAEGDDDSEGFNQMWMIVVITCGTFIAVVVVILFVAVAVMAGIMVQKRKKAQRRRLTPNAISF